MKSSRHFNATVRVSHNFRAGLLVNPDHCAFSSHYQRAILRQMRSICHKLTIEDRASNNHAVRENENAAKIGQATVLSKPLMRHQQIVGGMDQASSINRKAVKVREGDENPNDQSDNCNDASHMLTPMP